MGAVVPLGPPPGGLEAVRLLPDGSLDHDTLPAIVDARLPATYEAAKTAIAECWQIDEAKDWADKAAALATYAKLSEDKALETMAIRVRGWAVRRVGELLDEVKPAANQHGVSAGGPGSPGSVGKMKAGQEAGLSRDQTKNAIRVARVPDAEFERQIEGDDPPRVKELAAQGTRKMGTKEAALRAMREAQAEPTKPPEIDLGKRTVAEYHAAVQLVGMVDDLLREAQTLDLDVAARGLDDAERRHLADLVERASEWLAVVATRADLHV